MMMSSIAAIIMMLALGSASGTPCEVTSSTYCASWIMNPGEEYSSAPFLDHILTDVQSIDIDGDYLRVVASGIPKFETLITNEVYDTLESRPKASSDFPNGIPIVQVGDEVSWGTSVGYQGSHGCADGSSGYWPTGPSCPAGDNNKTTYLPLQPRKTFKRCYQPMGSIGLFSNGVNFFGYLDGTSYNDESIWNSLAVKFEVYDVDINGGHATNYGQYHIHGTTNMLPVLKGENGTDQKSSVWGFAADGYPILGPYVKDGVVAQSCWKARDYFDPAKGGCGFTGERTCVLVDMFNVSKGTVEIDLIGPNVTTTVTTQSDNTISSESGIYLEDYYYDASCTEQGNEYLDEHNGRVDPKLGYVYHMTSAFPYNVGPTFRGKLHSNGLVASCQTTTTSTN